MVNISSYILSNNLELPKIKYFISDSRDPSKGLIQRLEISFDGFLKDLPLIFELNKRYRGEFSKQENSIFSLQKGSYENLAKITKEIYQKIILSLNNAYILNITKRVFFPFKIFW